MSPAAAPVTVRVSVASFKSSPCKLTVMSKWSVAVTAPAVVNVTSPPVASAAMPVGAVIAYSSFIKLPLKLNGTVSAAVRTPPDNATRKVTVASSSAAASPAGACLVMVTVLGSSSVMFTVAVLPALA